MSNKPKKWHGLPAKRFRKYRTWINRHKPGICGTYVSAVMLDDLFREEYGRELDKEKVIKGLKSVIDDRFPYKGTFPWDLKLGLNYVLGDFPEWKAKMSLIPDKVVVERLNQPDPRPVAVGTTKVLGSPYKNHWLAVYAYGYNADGKLFFKGYDNHGRYTAVVPASQTFGCVWIEQADEG
ncbi:dihydrolipoamide dehydrogenase [Atopococcus tabaci]|uniref:dihydrolipoamide dehydrogenase n=1 Tax=Atopococcus tabaci TaxID=269774 RepID=UPI00240927AB|nr:dihydrolipoamide dehydrogenase [Atopococcus tabaci]